MNRVTNAQRARDVLKKEYGIKISDKEAFSLGKTYALSFLLRVFVISIFALIIFVIFCFPFGPLILIETPCILLPIGLVIAVKLTNRFARQLAAYRISSGALIVLRMLLVWTMAALAALSFLSWRSGLGVFWLFVFWTIEIFAILVYVRPDTFKAYEDIYQRITPREKTPPANPEDDSDDDGLIA